jgi:hypothetical protein
MSDDELHYDPVADGPPPSIGKVDMLFMGAFAVLAVMNFSLGDVTVGLLLSILALDIWFNARNERSAYLHGYVAAVKATGDQLNADMEVEDD